MQEKGHFSEDFISRKQQKLFDHIAMHIQIPYKKIKKFPFMYKAVGSSILSSNWLDTGRDFLKIKIAVF